MKTVEFSTSQKFEIIDLTSELEDFVSKSRIKEGICLVFTPHATAAVILNENEKGLEDDIMLQVKTMFSSDYKHNKIDDKLILGTWQSLLFCEFDGPRSDRRVIMVAK